MEPTRRARRNTLWVAGGGTLLALALIWIGLRWPRMLVETQLPLDFPFQTSREQGTTLHPLLELLKLALAAVIGVLLTGVHKRSQRDKPLGRSMQQAQVLLCVAGALVMIIIGNSIARAFGIAGAASVIRFRTPVKDPKDITILFLLLGLGMTCGLGAFAVAGIGTVFVAVMLVVLDQIGEPKQRKMMLQVVVEGPEFPAAHVRQVLSNHGVRFEPREFSQGAGCTARYVARISADDSLEEIAAELMAGGVKSVTWDKAKKRA